MIGGSQLFHAAVFWSADIASRIVDLVHFSSPSSENVDLVRQKAKQKFWDGIVVDWVQVENYIAEDDVVVIGPGLPREEGLHQGEVPTAELVDRLLASYADKKWVVDGGALQEMNPDVVSAHMILTPHQKEFATLISKVPQLVEAATHFGIELEDLPVQTKDRDLGNLAEYLRQVSHTLSGATIVLKGVRDLVVSPRQAYVINGGNAGLTKGGTGDVLAGLIGALYCTHQPEIAAAAASWLVKTAADELFLTHKTYFKTSQLVDQIPLTLGAVTP